MPRPMPLDDFRAVRVILEDEDFALVPQEADRPPGDLIAKETWEGIMTLPDDVSIRTSNEYGQLLQVMDRGWDGWIESLSAEYADPDPIQFGILDFADEFHAATYNSLHGFYRQAFGCLRSGLETIAIGTYCQAAGQAALFQEREAGSVRIEFGKACDGLVSVSSLSALRTRLRDELNDSIFDAKRTGIDEGGWARRLYWELSEYEHCRPDYRNIDMWESNGPVFSPKAFTKFVATAQETAALCFMMVKIARPDFVLPAKAEEIWTSEIIMPSKIAVLSREILFWLFITASKFPVASILRRLMVPLCSGFSANHYAAM